LIGKSLFAALILFAGRPGKERTRHGCASEYMRNRIIPPPNPSLRGEREIRVVIILRRPRSSPFAKRGKRGILKWRGEK
jgi:hypothetical protein